MVYLLLQPVFLDLVKSTESDRRLTSDELYEMWTVATKAKASIFHGRRLENLSWRLWYETTMRTKRENVRGRTRDTDAETEGDVETEAESGSRPNSSVGANDSAVDASDSSGGRSDGDGSGGEWPRPLMASACSSILAEIQNAAMQQRSSILGLASPPIALSPPSHLHPRLTATPEPVRLAQPASHRPRRKKNVDKFLKKFQTNLEDIVEQFDEKTNLEEGERGDGEHEDVPEEDEGATEPDTRSPTGKPDDLHGDLSFETLTDSAHPAGATDDDMFELGRSPESLLVERQSVRGVGRDAARPRAGERSLLSRLLRGEQGILSGSSSTLASPTTRIAPEPVHSQAPAFLFSSNSGSLINSQLELMANARYDRLRDPLWSPGMRSPALGVPPASGSQHGERRPQRSASKPPVIDATALSTSLSTNKLAQDEDFDAQVIIW